MKQLFITINTSGDQSATYCFSDMPVMIGRSPKCHLSICHEAVSRELCNAWVEDDGVTIRVEEHPALTNPLKFKGREICGGVSGESLRLGVGPVEIVLRTKPVDQNSTLSAGHFSSHSRIILLLGSVVLLMMLILFGKKHADRSFENFSDLPRSPLYKSSSASKPFSRARAQILASRAEEILGNHGVTPKRQIEAASLMSRAVTILEAVAPKEAVHLKSKSDALHEKINDEYKRRVLEFRHALELGDEKNVTQIASTLLEYLGEGTDPLRRRLKKLTERRL